MGKLKSALQKILLQSAPWALLVLASYYSSLHFLSRISAYHTVSLAYVFEGVHDNLLQFRYLSFWILSRIADLGPSNWEFFGLNGFFQIPTGKIRHVFYHTPVALTLPKDLQVSVVLYEWLLLSLITLSLWRIGARLFQRSAFSFVIALSFFWVVQYQKIAQGTSIYYPYDSLIMLVFLWGIYFQYRQNWAWYYPVFALGIMVRESALSLLFLYVVTSWKRVPRKTQWRHIAMHMVIYFALQFCFEQTLSVSRLNFLMRHWVLIFNFFTLLRFDFWLFFLGLGGFSLILVVFNYRYLKDPFFVRLFWFLPVLFVFMLKVGMVDEIRCLNEFPIAICLLLMAIGIERFRIPPDCPVSEGDFAPFWKWVPSVTVVFLLAVSLYQTHHFLGFPVGKTFAIDSASDLQRVPMPLSFCREGIAFTFNKPISRFEGEFEFKRGVRYVVKFAKGGLRSGPVKACEIDELRIDMGADHLMEGGFRCAVQWHGDADQMIIKARDESCASAAFSLKGTAN